MKLIEKLRLLFWKYLSKENIEDLDNLVAYICGDKALPKPLEAEEENSLLLRLKDGDESARNTLIEHNLRLVVYIAKKFETSGIEMEDLISIGSIGLIKAVRTYSIDKNIKLATYASRCIENEILMQLRKNTRRRAELSLDDPLSSDDEGNCLCLSDIIPVEEDSVSKGLELSSEKRMLMEIVSHLDSREQTIMILRFGLSGGEEKTQKEVADLMGISQSYISRIEKKILSKMRKKILNMTNVY